jgi:hypothetical protein
MTRVIVESYDDLDSCREISGKGADVVAELMNEGIETVVYIPGWMADDLCLEPISGGKTLFVGFVEDYSEKSWKVHQDGARHAYVAKSQAVVFESESGEIETPQQELSEFAVGDSR